MKLKFDKNLIIIGVSAILLVIIFASNIQSNTSVNESTPNEWLYNTLENTDNKNIIVVSHLVPLWDILPSEFQRDGMMMTPYPDMTNCEKVSLWVYAHLHLTPLSGYYVDLPGGFNGKRFYDVDCKPLVDLSNGITFASTASIKWSSYGKTPPTSFVLYTESGSNVATIKYRNHDSHQWIDTHSVTFPYNFDTTTSIWFYSDTHLGTCLHVGGCNNFTRAIADINSYIPIDYSFGAGDLTHNDATFQQTYLDTIQTINAQNYYILGNHDLGDWSIEPNYNLDIGNLRVVGLSQSGETLPLSFLRDDSP
jgi:hypothetical protein